MLVGESMTNRGAAITGESWKQLFGPAAGLALAVLLLLLLREPPAEVLGACAACLALLVVMTGILTFSRRRSGIPRGVLRLSAEGYRFGAKERDSVLGHLRPWPKNMVIRWSLIGENARFRGIRLARARRIMVLF